MKRTTEQLLEQWMSKKEKNPEKYETISVGKEEAIHKTENISVKAVRGGIKLFKKNELVFEEKFFNNSSKTLIVVKKLQELILYREDKDTYTYFGSKENLSENEDTIDELLLYFNDAKSGMLLQAKKEKGICYLVNVGQGNEAELLEDLWFHYKRNVVTSDEK